MKTYQYEPSTPIVLIFMLFTFSAGIVPKFVVGDDKCV